MKYQQWLNEQIVPEWKIGYVKYQPIKEILQPIKLLADRMIFQQLDGPNLQSYRITNNDQEELQKILIQDQKFGELFINYFEKWNYFFEFKYYDGIKKYLKIKLNMKIWKSIENVGMEKDRQLFTKVLKQSYQQMYKQLLLLEKYAIVNKKTLKKIQQHHRKIKQNKEAGLKLIDIDLYTLNQTGFVKKKLPIVQLMIQEVTDTYLTVFYNQNRKKGKEQLEKIAEQKQLSNLNYFYYGGFLGGSIIFLCLMFLLFSFTKIDFQNEVKYIFPIFRGPAYIILYIWLLGWNVYGWTRNNINYKMIFGFNHHSSKSSQIFQRASYFTLIWIIVFLIYIIKKFQLKSSDEDFQKTNIVYYPLGNIFNNHLIKQKKKLKKNFILFESFKLFNNLFKMYSITYYRIFRKQIILIVIWIVIFLYALFPSKKHFNGQGRMYTLDLLKQAILFCCYPTNFKLNWLTDQMISFTGPMKDLDYTLCFYTSNFRINSELDLCQDKKRINFMIFFQFAPFLMRIIQCIKQARQKNEYTGLDFFNGIKYLMSILTSVFSYIYIFHQSEEILSLWVSCAIISTVYSFYWDLKIDWGFLQPNSKNLFLRKELSFGRVSYYYTAMIVNLLLRVTWVFSISPQIVSGVIYPDLFKFLICFVEMFRRALWNFFRVEKEHVHNVGTFQAVDSVALPFDSDENLSLYEIQQKLNIFFQRKIKKDQQKMQKVDINHLKTPLLLESVTEKNTQEQPSQNISEFFTSIKSYKKKSSNSQEKSQVDQEYIGQFSLLADEFYQYEIKFSQNSNFIQELRQRVIDQQNIIQSIDDQLMVFRNNYHHYKSLKKDKFNVIKLQNENEN